MLYPVRTQAVQLSYGSESYTCINLYYYYFAAFLSASQKKSLIANLFLLKKHALWCSFMPLRLIIRDLRLQHRLS